MTKTYSAKPSELMPAWYVVDAKDQILGRLATTVAAYLLGKTKPSYTPHLLSGDYVVVINAASVRVTGKKLTDKIYYHYSGYPGGLSETTLAAALAKDPSRVITHAVAGMLPKNRLRAQMLLRLRVYPLAEHPHEPQNPKLLEVSHGRN